MAEWTPDPERHRPEGMEMAGRVESVRPELGDPDIETVRQGLNLCPDDWPIQNEASLAALDRIAQRLRRA